MQVHIEHRYALGPHALRTGSLRPWTTCTSAWTPYCFGLTTTVERLMVVKPSGLWTRQKGDDLAPGQPGAIKLHKLMEYLVGSGPIVGP
jgi:hypothetical protein